MLLALQLDSGTLSPLLRRMEQNELVRRERRAGDERVVAVVLGERGLSLRAELAHIPAQIAAGTGLPDMAAARALIDTLSQLTETMQAVGARASKIPTPPNHH